MLLTTFLDVINMEALFLDGVLKCVLSTLVPRMNENTTLIDAVDDKSLAEGVWHH